MARLTHPGGRNTVNAYPRTQISPVLAASTIVDERIPADTLVQRVIAQEPIAVGTLAIERGQRFWLVALSAVSSHFPQRFAAVVERDGQYQCSLGSAQREVLVARATGKYERVTETNPTVAVAIELVKRHRAHRRAAAAAEAAAQGQGQQESRYCPLYRTAISETWKPFTEAGEPISFASEAEALAYIAPIRTAETRVECMTATTTPAASREEQPHSAGTPAQAGVAWMSRAECLCREAGYQFRLYGRYYRRPQYRYQDGEWTTIPSAARDDYETHASAALDRFALALAAQIEAGSDLAEEAC